jgi:hypothetical protein
MVPQLIMLLALFGPFRVPAAPGPPRAAEDSVLPSATTRATARREEEATLEVRVDPRLQLLSILFHLAGAKEYNFRAAEPYVAAVDSFFAPWREHPAVAMTRRLSAVYHVGYFVPMNLAVHLGPPPAFALGEPLDADSSLHRTWKVWPDSTRHYVDLLRAFWADADVDAFMRRERSYYAATEARLRAVVDSTVDAAWFASFWGVPARGRFVVVPGLITGRASYGVSFSAPGLPDTSYAIVGLTETDSVGLPVPPASFTRTVVHELNHPFVDPLVNAHHDELAAFGDSLVAPVSASLRRQGYDSWDADVREALVRAAVVRYLEAHAGSAAARKEARAQAASGFVWVPQLARLMAEYQSARDRYPDFEAFMPRVVAYLRQAAETR